MKVKFFHAEHYITLEDEVNEFIKDKKVINVSYSLDGRYDYCHHSCCVLYQERMDIM